METLSKYRHFLQKSAIFRGNLSIFKKYPNQIYHSIFFKILQSLFSIKEHQIADILIFLIVSWICIGNGLC